jgi:hypothetical protein
LQKKFKQVTFIGVSIDDEVDKVKPFVDTMGDKMDYRVAIDARDGKHGRMTQTWLDASGQEGIPAAYIINGDGKVAWIGLPNEMDQPLKQIVDGEWDLVAKAAEYKKDMEDQKYTKQAEERLDKLIKDKEYAEALKVCDEIVLRKIELTPQFRSFHLALLVQLNKEPEKIIASAKEALNAKEEGAEKPAGKVAENILMALRAILSPMDVLNPDSEAKPADPTKLDPTVAKFAAAQADAIDAMLKAEEKKNAGEKPAAKPDDEEGTTFDDAENGFGIADNKFLLARAYEAAGEKEKAIAQLDDGVKVLNGTVRAAKAMIKDLKEMRKSISGDAADAKPGTETSGKAKP